MKHGTRYCGCSPTLEENAVKAAVMQAISEIKENVESKDILFDSINEVVNPFNDNEGLERMRYIQKNIDQYGTNIIEFDEALVHGLVDRIIVKEDNQIIVHFKAGISKMIKVK